MVSWQSESDNNPGTHQPFLVLAVPFFDGPFFSVIVELVLFGRHVPEKAVQPPIVVPIDLVEGEFLDVG